MTTEVYTKEKGVYLHKNPTWHAEDSPWKATQILKIINKNKIEAKTIAEIGCGAGEILNQLYLKMANDVTFTGFDISPDAICLAKERANERLQFRHEDLLLQNVNYDLLLIIDVFEHVDDYINFVRHCKDKAKFTIFHIPLDISVQGVIRNKLLHWRHSLGHLHFFSKETAIATLIDSGYEVLDFFYTAGSVELSSKSFTSKLAILPRKLLYKMNKDVAVRFLGGYSLLVLAR